MRLSRQLAGDLSSPFQARHALRPLVSDLGSRAADVLLVVSELVANSVKHVGGGTDRPIELRAELDRDLLTLEVCDEGTDDWVSRPRRSGGFGLEIVQELSDAWGVRRNGETCVWAVFDATRG